MIRGLYLRARRLLKNYPRQLKSELDHLRITLQSPKNGYPVHMINQWFSEFKRELQRKPHLLEVRTRLNPEDMFLKNNKQQVFQQPSALDRFPDALDSTWDRLEEQSEAIAQVQETLAPAETNDANPELNSPLFDAALSVPSSVIGTQGANNTWTKETMELRRREDALLDQVPRHPVLIVPYVKGIGERLQQIARQADCATWWSYPGRASDRFSKFKGQIHPSKANNTVYCTECLCGLKYIGESLRNLKIRLHEHTRKSSKSTLSMHFQQFEGDPDHGPALDKTVILVRESNTRKRKLMESICIKHKDAHLCNAGVSLELPGCWDVCIPGLKEQLKAD